MRKENKIALNKNDLSIILEESKSYFNLENDTQKSENDQ